MQKTFDEKCPRVQRTTHVAYDIQRTHSAQKADAAILVARAHNAVITGNLMLITIMYSETSVTYDTEQKLGSYTILMRSLEFTGDSTWSREKTMCCTACASNFDSCLVLATRTLYGLTDLRVM